MEVEIISNEIEESKNEEHIEEKDNETKEEPILVENNSYFIKTEDKKDSQVLSQKKKEKPTKAKKQIREKKQKNNNQQENIFTAPIDNNQINQNNNTEKDIETKNDQKHTEDNTSSILKIEKLDHITLEENKEILIENNKEKKEISINKNIYTEIEKINVESIDQDLFSLDKILNDFNQYFTSQSIHEDQHKKENNDDVNNNVNNDVNNKIKHKKTVPFHNEDLEDIQNEMKKNEMKKEMLNNPSQISMMKKNILFNQQSFTISYTNLKQSQINIQNLFQSVIEKENRISQKNISLQLQSGNSSYLLLYLENPYLLNKIDHSLIITNLKNRKSIQVNNQQYLLLSNCTFYLTENCSLLIPLMIKQEMNDQSGKMSHHFLPYI